MSTGRGRKGSEKKKRYEIASTTGALPTASDLRQLRSRATLHVTPMPFREAVDTKQSIAFQDITLTDEGVCIRLST